MREVLSAVADYPQTALLLAVYSLLVPITLAACVKEVVLAAGRAVYVAEALKAAAASAPRTEALDVPPL